MQGDYVGNIRNKRTYLYDGESLINNINMKIEQYNQNDDMIIYIQNAAKGKKSELVNGLSIVSNLVYEKQKASCFSNSELTACLIENKIASIELVGVDGNYCVGLSALEGAKLGFNVKLNLECVGIANPERFVKMKARLLNAGIAINDAL